MNPIIKARLDLLDKILNKIKELNPNEDDIGLLELKVYLVNEYKYQQILGDINTKSENKTIGQKINETDLDNLIQNMILDNNEIN